MLKFIMTCFLALHLWLSLLAVTCFQLNISSDLMSNNSLLQLRFESGLLLLLMLLLLHLQDALISIT
jgi:hypothetical protein